MNKLKLELTLKLKKTKLSITKANTAKEEIDVKLLERELEVERMKEHQKLQDDTIKTLKVEVLEIEKKLAEIE